MAISVGPEVNSVALSGLMEKNTFFPELKIIEVSNIPAMTLPESEKARLDQIRLHKKDKDLFKHYKH